VSIVVFTGPTLDALAGSELLDAVFLPPAAQGDVYRAAEDRPSAICIIDGTFEREPAVWHKEILWALSRGIHVLGASSMGALRAAELWPFGMTGIGKVFEWLRDGVIEDDDEVAVAHADGEQAYRASSEALVNIRATLLAAEAGGAVSRDLGASLLRIAKVMFYPERSYRAVLQRARSEGISSQELATLSEFLEKGRINQKKQDACALLRHVAENRSTFLEPFKPEFQFQHTETWDDLVGAIHEKPNQRGNVQDDDLTALRAELRLMGLHELAERGAHLRAQAARAAERAAFTISPEQQEEFGGLFRLRHQLQEGESERSWRGQNGLSEADFSQLMNAEMTLQWFRTLYADRADRHLKDELLAGGYYGLIRKRADHKRALLAARGLSSPELKDAGLSLEELLGWYIHGRLKQPATASAASVLHQIGVRNLEEFTREALREYLYLRLLDEKSSGAR
jgi:hypothetical protein